MILLASQSPQRARLLELARLAFRVVASTADEEAIADPDPAALALARARVKAEGAAVANGPAITDGVVLGADTVVALGGVEYAKPRDRAHAVEILTALSGTTHRVVTGHWLLRRAAGAIVAAAGETVETRVTLRRLTEAEIRAYVDSGESDGRAGAYAIQERADRFVTKLDGPWDSVVGLHVDAVKRLHLQVVGSPPLPASGF